MEGTANSHPLELTLRTLSDDESDPLPVPGVFGGCNIIAESNMPRDELSQATRRHGTPGSIETVRGKYPVAMGLTAGLGVSETLSMVRGSRGEKLCYT